METVVASMILSGAVLALGAISSNALVGTRLNQHYRTAAAIAEKQLALLDFMGIDEFVENGAAEGVVEDQEPGYRWEVTTEYQGTDSVYLVSIKVSWLEGKRPYDITVQTMLNGTGLTTLPLTTEGP